VTRRALLPAALAVALAAGVLSALPATAEGTCTRDIFGPNDPRYAGAERNPQDPSRSFNTEQWYLFDCIPQSAPLASDPEGAAGMSVNRAWQEFGYGSDEVLVAYMEGGINWRRADSAPDLRTRVHLNRAELPLPQRADGTTAATHDLDGNGVVDVDDWAQDRRVGRLHERTAGGITAEDLIVAFSDGTDADGNGYVDDISGWNFHRDTNDPQTDQSVYNHANAEMNVIAGERDNGIGGVGFCPSCRVLPVKIGDESIDRTDRVAQGIVFAVDSGAQVVAGVSVSLGLTPQLAAAFRYAYEKGSVVAWASNDFESADHTDGMFFDQVWPGNAMVSDQTNRLSQAGPNDRLARTFRSRSGVTSYGPHNLFTVASTNGSTSAATPGVAGVAAMVYSAGVLAQSRGVLDSPLDAGEVKQVVRATASDVDTTPPSTVGQPFPAQPGFDIHYGYGRPNVHRAMKAVVEGQVPPTADIRSPRWYQLADPTVQDSVTVEADVAARRSASYTYEVQFGLGPQPTEEQFTTFASGSGTGPRRVAHELDLSRIPESFWRGAYETTADRLSIERYDVTVRVQVRDAQGRLGEDRKAFLVRHDDTQLPGFPKDLGSGLEPSPSTADLDGDGVLEVVQPTADGVVHVLRADGTPLPGFPVRTRTAPGFDGSHGVSYDRAWAASLPRPGDGISNPAAVGDLDHDGGLDVVVSTTNGRVYAWDALGRLRPGFPVETDRRFARQEVPVPDTPYVRNRSAGAFGAPVLGDLDGDQRLDVVLGGWDGRVYAWTPDGTLLPGWPAETENPDKTVPPGFVYARDFKVATTPALADVDGDGRQDVLVALQDTSFPEESNEGPVTGYVTGFTSGGRLLPGYPVRVPGIAQGYGTAQDFITEGVQTPAVYDTPAGPQMVLNMGLAQANVLDLRRRVLRPLAPAAFAQEGTLQSASPMVHFTTSASLGRLVPGSPLPQAVQAGNAATDVAEAIVATPGLGVKVRSGLTAYDLAAGAPVPAYAVPRPLQGLPFLTAPAIADVSGDGRPDVVVGTDSVSLHAFDGLTGAVVPGFPKHTGGWTLWTPAVADLDGDGRVEVLASTREGYLHAWPTPGLASANTEAWSYHQDDRNTGRYGVDTRPPSGVADLAVTRDGAQDVLSFSSPGDDWRSGTPARYEVFRGSRPLTQDDLATAERVPVEAAAVSAGAPVQLRVPAVDGATYAVRAVDDAGNLGPVRVRAASVTRPVAAPRVDAPVAAPRPSGSRLPATGTEPLLALVGLVLLGAAGAVRRTARSRGYGGGSGTGTPRGA
jgi:uncharacterized protein (DUF2141 family)